MRLGLALPQFGALCDASRVAEFARTAEELGYRSLWVGDRVLTPVHPSDRYPGSATDQPYPPAFTAALDPLIVLAAAATATSTARLGMSTLNAPWHNALLLGRALTSVDNLSSGRLLVGFGIGWLRDEYRATGVDWSTRGARLDECLDVLAALWTRNPVEHHGRFFAIPAAHVDLRPTRPGGPPVYLGGFTPAAMNRIGRRATGWLPSTGLPADHAAKLWRLATSAAEAAGRDPGALRRELRVNIAAGTTLGDTVEVLAEAADAGVDGAFVDLHYCTRSIDEALDLAGRLSTAVGHSH